MASTLDGLRDHRTVDLTTFGARSGEPSRIEIWAWVFEDRYVITGTPGPRDWLANVIADQRVVVHAAGADHHGEARVVIDDGFKERFFRSSETQWYRSQASIEDLVARSPMIEVAFSPD